MPPGRLPKECRKGYFIHIGYSDDRADNDVYSRWGPVVAPNRIPRTLETLENARGEGLMAYSEGVFDDVNKAILGGLRAEGFQQYRRFSKSMREDISKPRAGRWKSGRNGSVNGGNRAW